MKNDDEIIESLIEGGLISSEIESLLLKNKDEGVSLPPKIGQIIKR